MKTAKLTLCLSLSFTQVHTQAHTHTHPHNLTRRHTPRNNKKVKWNNPEKIKDKNGSTVTETFSFSKRALIYNNIPKWDGSELYKRRKQKKQLFTRVCRELDEPSLH